MSKLLKLFTIFAVLIIAAKLYTSSTNDTQDDLPLIAIANYGPHPSLFATIDGIKKHLESQGYIEGQNIRIIVSDVNYDTSLIIQMLTKLKASKPDIIVAISTPIAQSAKNMIKDIPVIFADVTDPVSTGLADGRQTNITGASDMQDITLMFGLAKQLLQQDENQPLKLGILHSTGEANDKALIQMLEKHSADHNIKVVAVPIEHSRDVATRIRSFKGKVDFIYTGSSGAIQSAMPVISAAADDMKIPLINFNSDEVINHQALASYGVSHHKVGANAAKIVIRILNGEKIENIDILYPSTKDHAAYISQKKADFLGIQIPTNAGEVQIENLNIQQ